MYNSHITVEIHPPVILFLYTSTSIAVKIFSMLKMEEINGRTEIDLSENSQYLNAKYSLL